MFTGIVEDLVKIEEIKKTGASKKTKIDGLEDKNRHDTEITINVEKMEKLKIGDSVAINGVCLTIAKLDKTMATFQIIDETIKKSCFSSIKKGDKVNIERSLKVGDRLEGHFILGHVDCVGKIEKIEKNNTGSKIMIEIADRGILHLIAPKGSITIDGISLTVVSMVDDKVEIALIPHTLENTTLGIKNIGDLVNVEVDILARYVSNIYQNIGNNKKNSKIY
ncbi:MAG: riboflavin synthase [Thermoproteota archaeon]|nr:riboflavin synthase [Thermoproteota archaeon]